MFGLIIQTQRTFLWLWVPSFSSPLRCKNISTCRRVHFERDSLTAEHSRSHDDISPVRHHSASHKVRAFIWNGQPPRLMCLYAFWTTLWHSLTTFSKSRQEALDSAEHSRAACSGASQNWRTEGERTLIAAFSMVMLGEVNNVPRQAKVHIASNRSFIGSESIIFAFQVMRGERLTCKIPLWRADGLVIFARSIYMLYCRTVSAWRTDFSLLTKSHKSVPLEERYRELVSTVLNTYVGSYATYIDYLSFASPRRWISIFSVLLANETRNHHNARRRL